MGEAVAYARTELPEDHPRHHRIGGGALAECRRKAANAVNRLMDHDLYDPEKIKRIANGGIDMAVLREKRAAEQHRLSLVRSVERLLASATLDQLHSVLAILGEQGNDGHVTC